MRKLFAAIALTVAGTAAAQEPPLLRDRTSDERPTLLILGAAHFANPGRDHNNIAVEDITTPARQREIEAVVQQLADFRPTHVAIERTAMAIIERENTCSMPANTNSSVFGWRQN